MAALPSPPFSSSNSQTCVTTTNGVPPFVYRVHRPSAQTRYSFGEGFRSKNQTTIVNYTSILSTFSLAHLHGATNISSPFISAYDNLSQAMRIAEYYSQKYDEETWVVKIDTRHLARGPVFRADAILADEGKEELTGWDAELHRGEYLIMYRIPPQAIVDETPVGRKDAARWGAVGA